MLSCTTCNCTVPELDYMLIVFACKTFEIPELKDPVTPNQFSERPTPS